MKCTRLIKKHGEIWEAATDKEPQIKQGLGKALPKPCFLW